jgi:hypothetical protein
VTAYVHVRKADGLWTATCDLCGPVVVHYIAPHEAVLRAAITHADRGQHRNLAITGGSYFWWPPATLDTYRTGRA